MQRLLGWRRMKKLFRNNIAKPNHALSIGVCLFLVAITWSVFGQTLGHEFINYDDPDYIFKNPEISKGLTLHGVTWAFSHKVSGNWHPLTMITHMLDCQLYGLRPGGHHFTNVLLHTLAVLLLFLVLRRMTGALWCGAFVAALFAIHPLRVESVAWVAERKDVLSGVFFMLTLAAYVRYVDKDSLASYLTVVFLFALGLMSKPMVVTLPLVLLLLDYWPLRRFPAQTLGVRGNEVPALARKRPTTRKLLLEKLPLLLLAGIAGRIALMGQSEVMSPIETVPLWVRFYNALVNYLTYIWQMFWPVKLGLFYPYPSRIIGWVGIVALAVLLGITYKAWALRKRSPCIIVGWLWYLGMLVPVIGLVQVGQQAEADRYTYLPHIGLYLLSTWTAMDMSTSWRQQGRILGMFAVAALMALTSRAAVQTSYWKNSETIWNRTLAVTLNNAVAHQSLGQASLTAKKIDDAIFHLQEALKILPDDIGNQSNTDNAWVHDRLATALLEKGRVREAIAHYKTALQLQPDADIHESLAKALWQDGEIDQAIAHWEKTLSMHPKNSQVQTSLGTAFLRKHLVGEAIDHYEKALAIAPNFVATLNNLALLLSTSSDARFRDGARAVSLAEQADKLSRGKNATILRTLAAAYAESGRFTDATKAAERGLQLALAQSDTALASKLRMDLDLYRMNFPRHDGP
jgi:protein O-mannosyl-transferase